MLISCFFNHVGRRTGEPAAAGLTFSGCNSLLTKRPANEEHPMTFVGRLSVVTAYLAMAFVGAIVLGMI
ncbi:hypothetical protein EHH60_14025 [Bradyrhizobium sp. RP6]|nr:hypothetical protein EHH60_14025 [Bradyrhizobium sp. RP6]